MVDVRIDPEDDCINTADVNISFSQDILEAIEFSQGNSILTLWVKNPEISQNSGQVSFTGGIPGGFCGRLRGDPGKSNLLGKIVFQVKEIQPELFSDKVTAKVKFLDNCQVLLNDGLGTPAKLNNQNAEFEILSGIPKTPKKEWQEELEKDTVPPEQFEVKVLKDPSVFNGKYFIVFSTTDKQTGVDHYEIQEGKGDWKRAVSSPYLLENQRLTSIIKVRAIDRAGNERIVKYLPAKKPFPYWVIILILFGLVFGCLIYKKTKNKWRGIKNQK